MVWLYLMVMLFSVCHKTSKILKNIKKKITLFFFLLFICFIILCANALLSRCMGTYIIKENNSSLYLLSRFTTSKTYLWFHQIFMYNWKFSSAGTTNMLTVGIILKYFLFSFSFCSISILIILIEFEVHINLYFMLALI